ncbi:MAG: inositol monophosphatase [Polyangiaceae bacterium]|nr:inositol monophosphatase [Polyangiaceae bacterium]MCW5792334.1 inositol monophosphatase [Polyangiaceae bacterium]
MSGLSTVELRELSEVAAEVAREAAALVLTGWRSRPDVRLKHPKDLVTEWDLRSEALIVERLGARAPFPVLGEEGGLMGSMADGPADSTADRSGPTWVCDPIDGTTNFAHGHPIWCVSIGLMQGGAPLVGAVAAPTLATDWRGYVGGPALRSGEPVRVSATQELGQALIATGFPPDRERAPDNNFASFERVKRRARAVRRCGSAALDLCFVADGTYDGYWERRVCVWDLAAAAAVHLGAGGELTALSGGPVKLEQGHVLATNGRIHAELLSVLSA